MFEACLKLVLLVNTLPLLMSLFTNCLCETE